MNQRQRGKEIRDGGGKEEEEEDMAQGTSREDNSTNAPIVAILTPLGSVQKEHRQREEREGQCGTFSCLLCSYGRCFVDEDEGGWNC